MTNYMLNLRYRNGLERTWDHIWDLKGWSTHHSILILLWTYMDNGHGGIFNFRYSPLFSNPRKALRNSFRKLLYLFLATSLTRKLERRLWPSNGHQCRILGRYLGRYLYSGRPRAPMTTRSCILTDQKHNLIVFIVDSAIVWTCM